MFLNEYYSKLALDVNLSNIEKLSMIYSQITNDLFFFFPMENLILA